MPLNNTSHVSLANQSCLNGLTAIIPILGDYELIEGDVGNMIATFQQLRNAKMVVPNVRIVLNHANWQRTYPFFDIESEKIQCLIAAEGEEIPSALCNFGVMKSASSHLTFALPRMISTSWVHALKQGMQTIHDDNAVNAVAPASKSLAGPPRSLKSWNGIATSAIPEKYQSGWLEMFSYLPMFGTIVSRELFNKLCGFSTSPILQEAAWWEFSRRCSESTTIESYACDAKVPPTSIDEIQFKHPLGLGQDIVTRRVVRRGASPETIDVACNWQDVEPFVHDLPASAASRTFSKLKRWANEHTTESATCVCLSNDSSNTSTQQPLRVLLVGGVHECAHNQLCFFNYFSRLEGKKELTWRTMLDDIADPIDLQNADIVIFSRVRSPNGRRLMDYCVEYSIPTLYMLDDNWFAVGKEWPEYKSVFTPGAVIYEDFIHCVRNASSVITYNSTLAEDLEPHCKSLITFPPNIDLDLFSSRPRTSKARRIVGYVGSPRRENCAFAALVDVSKKRDDFDVFLMSSVIPEELKSLPKNRFMYEPYVFGYQRYAQILSRCSPDILLAPNGNSRSDASRCPNKYLETTAIGAVGIYSDVKPYSQYVDHGVNGLLAGNESNQWMVAIEQLLDSPDQITAIAQAAKRDVEENFATPVLLDKFVEMLRSVAMKQTSAWRIAA